MRPEIASWRGKWEEMGQDTLFSLSSALASSSSACRNRFTFSNSNTLYSCTGRIKRCKFNFNLHLHESTKYSCRVNAEYQRTSFSTCQQTKSWTHSDSDTSTLQSTPSIKKTFSRHCKRPTTPISAPEVQPTVTRPLVKYFKLECYAKAATWSYGWHLEAQG